MYIAKLNWLIMFALCKTIWNPPRTFGEVSASCAECKCAVTPLQQMHIHTSDVESTHTFAEECNGTS